MLSEDHFDVRHLRLRLADTNHTLLDTELTEFVRLNE